jgi:KaiC/GvpD/RAD55 family RecA-like ATPase
LCPTDVETHGSTKAEGHVIEAILNGDLPPNTTIALIGACGTGTSTMAIQFVINSLRRRKKVFFILYDYVPELAVKYFRSFGFDHQPFVGSGKLRIINGGDFLRKTVGIETVADIGNLRQMKYEEISKVFTTGVMNVIQDNEPEPSTIVIDSFTALSPFIDIHSLYLTLAEGFANIRTRENSVLIVAHEGVLEGNFVQALTRFVDGVIWLKTEWSARGFTREFFIEKMRFTNVKTPSLDFTISNKGISLLPESLQQRRRAKSKVEPKPLPLTPVERISTGISELDTILSGGFPRGTFVCINGNIGTGTSTLCAQFVWFRLLAGGKVAYYCIDDPPETVIDQFRSFGWDITPFIDRKDIILSDMYALFRTGRREALRGASEPDTTKTLIGDFMKEENAKIATNATEPIPPVKVMDSFTTMAPYLDLKTAYVLAKMIADEAREANLTYLAVVRSGNVEANLLNACLGTADGILTLQNSWMKGKPRSTGERKLVRMMRIEKMAFTPIPPSTLGYEITPKGIILSKFK